MKKSLVAVGVVVAIGAVWTAGAWYSGKQIEQGMAEYIAKANQFLEQNAPQANLVVSYQDYQRGLFGSKANLIIRSSDSDVANGAEDYLLFTADIDHGPFPLAQLKRFNLLPSAASVHTELSNTKPLSKVFEITKGQSPLSADSHISYGGDVASSIALLPLEYQNEGTSLSFSGANIDANVNHNATSIAASLVSNKLEFTTQNQWGQTEKIAIQGLSTRGETKLGRFDLNIGDQQLDLKQLTINVDNRDALVMEGLQLVSKLGEDEKNLSFHSQYQVAALKVQGTDFGSGKLAINVDQLSGSAIKALLSQMMVIMQQADPSSQNYEDQMRVVLLQHVPQLLQNSPSFAITPLSWKNSKGESTLNLTLALQDPSTAPASNGPLNAVKQVDIKLAIPVAMATELMVQAAKVQGISEESAQRVATDGVQNLINLGQMFKLTQLKDGTISSNFQFANGQVELNGQKMSQEEFIGMFGALAAPLLR